MDLEDRLNYPSGSGRFWGRGWFKCVAHILQCRMPGPVRPWSLSCTYCDAVLRTQRRCAAVSAAEGNNNPQLITWPPYAPLRPLHATLWCKCLYRCSYQAGLEHFSAKRRLVAIQWCSPGLEAPRGQNHKSWSWSWQKSLEHFKVFFVVVGD